MRDTWIGSGVFSTDEDRTIECPACLFEWTESVYFNDNKVADEWYICPDCEEGVNYFEDKKEKQWHE